jgi:hypothetical protein
MKKKIACLLLFLSTFPSIFSSTVSYTIWHKDDTKITCFGDVHTYTDPDKDFLVLHYLNEISRPSTLFLEYSPLRRETLRTISPRNFNKSLLKMAFDASFQRGMLTFKLSDRRNIFGYELMNFLQNARDLEKYEPATHADVFNQTLSFGYQQPISTFINDIETVKKEINSLRDHEKISEKEKATLSHIEKEINDGQTILNKTIEKYEINKDAPLFESLIHLTENHPRVTLQFINKILYPFLQTIIESGFFIDILNETLAGTQHIILYAGNNHIIAVNKYLQRTDFIKKSLQGISTYHKIIPPDVIEKNQINDAEMAADLFS